MSVEFSQSEIDFLNSQQVGRLATVSPKNYAQVTPIIFAFDGKVFYFTTHEKTVKFSNMVKNPHVGFVVDIYENGGHVRKAVVVQGVAEEVSEDSEFSAAKKMLTEKLTFYQTNPIEKGINRLFRITPTRKISWGF